MTPRQQRAMELANHLHMRAMINETIKDGTPVDYAQIRAWAPMLREAGDLLMEMSRGPGRVAESDLPDPDPLF